jgi:hypothetical protein
MGAPSGTRDEYLDRAAAFRAVPDAVQWDALGGFVQIRHLIPLEKRERVAVLGAAKESGYPISTIVRNRESKPAAPRPPDDVQVLAEYVEQLEEALAQVGKLAPATRKRILPDTIRQIARRHVRGQGQGTGSVKA